MGISKHIDGLMLAFMVQVLVVAMVVVMVRRTKLSVIYPRPSSPHNNAMPCVMTSSLAPFTSDIFGAHMHNGLPCGENLSHARVSRGGITL